MPALNKRLFAIKRLANHIPRKSLKNIADSLWTSKMRYGLQLCAKVRLNGEESEDGNMKMLQIAQNKMLRVLDNSCTKDKRSKRDMLNRFDILSVNQVAAQIKLLEAWKSMNVEDYPAKMRRNETEAGSEQKRKLRPSTIRDLNKGGRLKSMQASFVKDAGRLWNTAPMLIKESKTLQTAKAEIRK